MLDLLNDRKARRFHDVIQELIALKIIASEEDTGIIQRAIEAGYIIHFVMFNTLRLPDLAERFELERLRHDIYDIEEAIKRMESVKNNVPDIANTADRVIIIMSGMKRDLLNKIHDICVR